MKIDTPAFKKLARRVEALDKMLSQHPMANDPELPGLLELHARRRDLSLQRKMAQRRVRDASGMIMREELSQRMRVLRRLGYISDDGVVKEKGKVACEMQTAHELVATELIFNGTVSEMDDANLVALTSALVWREERPHQGHQAHAEREGRSDETAGRRTRVREARERVQDARGRQRIRGIVPTGASWR